MSARSTGSGGRRGRVVVAVLLGTLLVGLTGLGIVGLSQPMAPPAARTPVPHASPTPTVLSVEEAFASRVAETVFAWDTTRDSSPDVVIDRVVALTDPAFGEVPGLVADLHGYLPPEPIWNQLGAFQTRQHLQVRGVVVPTVWGTVDTTTLPPGTTARTITATRHRDGFDHEQPLSSERPVTFTVFFTCPPSTGTCALLRLSRLDEPLQ